MNNKSEISSERRQHLIDTALRLFYAEGFHATGIDKILKESGVAKMTLYKHFKTKEDLILAALRRRDELWMAWFTSAVETRATAPTQRLLAIFDALEDWFTGRGPNPKFHGCAFINVAAEYADCDHPIHAVAAEHKRNVSAQILRWTTAAGAANPQLLAAQLSLLTEGAITLRHVANDTTAADVARRTAEKLLFS
jgi:AcrR family transcriptional regulator